MSSLLPLREPQVIVMGTFKPIKVQKYQKQLFEKLTGKKFDFLIIDEFVSMTKQEQIAKLKRTIQEAKEQVEQLEKGEESSFPDKLRCGQVVSFIDDMDGQDEGPHVVAMVDGYERTFVFVSLEDGGRWCEPLEFEECKNPRGRARMRSLKVLANTVEDYYSK